MPNVWTYADSLHLGHHFSKVWHEGLWRYPLSRAYPVYKLLRIPQIQLARLPKIPTREIDQKIRVEEHLSFPEARKKYFELQPKQKKVTYAQAAASRPPTAEMSTQTDDPSATSATAALRIRPCGPRTLVEPAKPPEIPQNLQPPKHAHANRAHLICPLSLRVALERVRPSSWSHPATAWIWTHQTARPTPKRKHGLEDSTNLSKRVPHSTQHAYHSMECQRTPFPSP
jgi:hypothetical protein